jgi:antitoxin (DNA-binding transcriptional repressor) of toxin-antitoxin stability system
MPQMSMPAIAPSPVARLLLELASRRATAGLEVGGRRIVLHHGAIVDVRPHGNDAALGAFLVASTRITADELSRHTAEAEERGIPLESLLVSAGLLDSDALTDARRALWLDRVVRGLSTDEARGAAPGPVTPEPTPAEHPGVATLPFVLDALARRAGFDRDAERVGQLANTWFAWRDTEDTPRARLWAELGASTEPLLTGQLFARHPGAPSRIAALVRAGLAQLSEGKPQVPQPDARTPAIVAPVHDPRAVDPAPAAHVAVPVATAHPRHAVERPLGIVPVESWLPHGFAGLDDPLDTFERRIAQLEQTGAPPEERARAWLELGEAQRFHFDSLDEAARASREAAAAAPHFADALDTAATLCAATGHPDHAYQYARALADAQLAVPEARAQALARAYLYGKRAQLDANALGALQEARRLAPEDATIAEQLARVHAQEGRTDDAAEAARSAGQSYLQGRPEQAVQVLWWAYDVNPIDVRTACSLAHALMATGRSEAALALALRALRMAPQDPVCQAALLAAATHAEQAARADLSAVALLDAIASTSGNHDALWGQLLRTLAASGAVIELAMLATWASLEGDNAARAERLAIAGEAQHLLPSDGALAAELCMRALEIDPTQSRALGVLARLSRIEGKSRVLSDALERALAKHAGDPALAGPIATQLFSLAAHPQLGIPALARHLLAQHADLLADHGEQVARIIAAAEAHDAEIRTLEDSVRKARSVQRLFGLVEIAKRMRDDPSRRAQARKLLEYVLEKRPDHVEANDAYEELLRLSNDFDATFAHWTRRAERAADPASRARHRLKQAYGALLSRELSAAENALEALLREQPRHQEALLLLSRIGQRKGAVPHRETLARRLKTGLHPRERARAALALAQLDADHDDTEDAAGHAELALSLDARHGEAALMVLTHAAHIPAARRAVLLRDVLVTLGPSPALLRALAQACFEAHDASGQRSALETYSQEACFDPLPALALCVLHGSGHDARALIDAIRLALAPGRLCESTAEAIRTAFSALWQTVSPHEGAQLLLDAADVLGEHGRLLLSWALPHVRDRAEPHFVRAVLDRLVARSRGDARRPELRRLAHYCREQRMLAAEARAYLRLLAIAPSDEEALTRLTSIYATTGEVERLMAVLTVRINHTEDDAERRERVITLALTALSFAGDSATAQSLMLEALAPARDSEGQPVDCDVSLLRRGLGVLLGIGQAKVAFDMLLELSADATQQRGKHLLEEAVALAEIDIGDPSLAMRAAMLGLETFPDDLLFLEHVERIGPALGDLTALRDTYRTHAGSIVEPDRKKAVLARGAYLLERLKAFDEAIDLAERVLQISPDDTLGFQHLERLSQHAGKYGALVRALALRAKHEPANTRRAELLSRAATISATSLNDLARAAELAVQAYQALPSDGFERLALQAVRQQSEVASATPKSAETFRDTLAKRDADSTPAQERIRALTTLAELYADVLRDDGLAAVHGRRALNLLESESNGSTSALEALRGRVTAVLGRTQGRVDAHCPEAEEDGLEALSPALEPKPEPPLARNPRRPLDTDARRSGADDADAFGRSSGTHAALGLSRVEEPAFQATRTAPRAELLSPEDDLLVRGVMQGVPEAVERMLAPREVSFTRSAALCRALLASVRREGPNLVALRVLRSLAEHLRRRDLSAVVSEVLALGEVLPPERAPTRLPSPADEATRSALAEARDDGRFAAAFAALGHVYAGAPTLFGKALAHFGVSASDFIASGEHGPLSDALEDAKRVLGLEYEAYLAPQGRTSIDVALTAPPAILVARDIPKDRVALRFRLAAAFERARPQSALLAGLGPVEANVVVTAIVAAFVRGAPERADVPREAALFTADLWRNLPEETQRQVELCMREVHEPVDAATLRAALRQRAARVGLVVCGSLSVALAQLGLDQSPAAPRLAGSETALAEALAGRDDVRDLVCFALSDAYLALRSRESS